MANEEATPAETPAKFEVGETVKGPGFLGVVKERRWVLGMWTYKCERQGEKDPVPLSFPERMLSKPAPPPMGWAVVSRPPQQ